MNFVAARNDLGYAEVVSPPSKGPPDMNFTYFLSLFYLAYLISYGFGFAVALGDWARVVVMGP